MKHDKIDGPDLTKLTSLHKANYGYSWHPVAAVPERCCKMVSRDRDIGQCSRKRGFGPEGAYCKLHDPAAIAAKNAALEAKWKAEAAESARKYEMVRLAPRMKAALEAIRDGHNDPSALAAEVLAEFKY